MNTALRATRIAPVTPDASHVFAAPAGPDRQAARIAALVDPAFLVETRWDAAGLVLSPPPEHPLLGRPVCRVEGCLTTAPSRVRICASCRRRLVEHGLAEDAIASAVLSAQAGPARGPGGCVVAGCARERVSPRQTLCRAHLDRAQTLEIPVTEFRTHPVAQPLPACAPCEVAACARQRRHHDGLYCEAHQSRLRLARCRDPEMNEQRWRLTEAPVGRGGQISLRGLAPVVVAEVLVGLQQRTRLDGVKTKEADLRRLCNQLRRQQVETLSHHVMGADPDGGFQSLCNSLTAHARRALASPETEITKDEWDLAVFGHAGTLSFTNITQRWLREVAKRWAADDLPKRRSTTFKVGLVVRHHLGCLVRLSQSLRTRPDRGENPAALDRRAMEAFLNGLAYQQSAGRTSADARIRACREVRKVLTTARAMGLTRPGGPAGGLGEDFAIAREDVPDQPEPAEPGRDLPQLRASSARGSAGAERSVLGRSR